MIHHSHVSLHGFKVKLMILPPSRSSFQLVLGFSLGLHVIRYRISH